jgi:Mrp family chromosome partitioning ATPase
MSEECTHNCETCGANCSHGHNEPQKEPMNKYSDIKKVIAVVSGKGGVGKSLITSLLAVEMRRAGKEVAILDADITGPSIPKAFGIKARARGGENGMFPIETETGIKVMSLNLLLEHESDPVAWRGPVIAGAVTQFWTDVLWEDVDYMFVDMPPGTGDVALTVFQSLPIDGIIIVTSPQDLASMIVEKAVKLAELMNVPILGLVENYSYFKCDKCGEKHYIFGQGNVNDLAKKYDIPTTAQLPIDPSVAKACDEGKMEDVSIEEIHSLAEKLLE